MKKKYRFKKVNYKSILFASAFVMGLLFHGSAFSQQLAVIKAINCGSSDAYTTADGIIYEGDDVSLITGENGTYSNTNDVADTEDDALYQTSRTGVDFTYNIPVPGVSTYTVTLHLAELYRGKVGARVIDVYMEDVLVWDDMDITEFVGKMVAADTTIESTVSDDTLNIRFEFIENGITDETKARVNGILVQGDASLLTPVDGMAFEGCFAAPVEVGLTDQLTPVFDPADATNKGIIWESSDESVAIVSGAGVITGTGIGTATIKGTTIDGGFKDSCDVEIIASTAQAPRGGVNRTIPGLIEAEDWDDGGKYVAFYDTGDDPGTEDQDWASGGKLINYTSAGEWLEYTVTVTPGKYTLKLYYSSGNNNIGDVEFTLDGEPLYTFTGTGMVNNGWGTLNTIIADVEISDDGDTEKVLRMELIDAGGLNLDAIEFIEPGIPVTGITFLDCLTTDMIIGASHQVSATVIPDNAGNPNFTFESINADIVSIDANGNISALAAGDATLVVTSEDGGFTDSCFVTVLPDVIVVTGVEMMDCPTDDVIIGETAQLSAVVSPNDADDQNVTWSSSDEAIATVDENGLVTAIAEGSATITVKTDDGEFTDVCDVTVPTAIKVNSSLEANVKVYPNPASDVINIQLKDINTSSVINIYSIEGKLLYNEEVNDSREIVRIDVDKLVQNENYVIINIENGDKSYSSRVYIK